MSESFKVYKCRKCGVMFGEPDMVCKQYGKEEFPLILIESEVCPYCKSDNIVVISGYENSIDNEEDEDEEEEE